MKQKGIIMKVQDGFCYVLTKDKQFLKLPLPPDVAVGQEIEWLPSDLKLKSKRGASLLWQKRWTPIAGIVASVLLMFGAWQGYSVYHQTPPSVYAYVSVDINPSVEFSIDQKGQVFEQDGENKDGTAILTKLATLHKPIGTAVQALFQTAKQDGYLDQNKEVIITATPATDATADAALQSIVNLQKTLVSEAQQTLTGTSVHVKGLVVSKLVRSKAQNLHLSPGKLVLFLQAQSQGVPVTIGDVQDESIAKIISEHHELANTFDQLNTQQVDGLLTKWETQKNPNTNYLQPIRGDKQGKPANDHLNQDHSIQNHSIQNNPIPNPSTQDMEQGHGKEKQQYRDGPDDQIQPSNNGHHKQDDGDQKQQKNDYKQHSEHKETYNNTGNPPEEVDLGGFNENPVDKKHGQNNHDKKELVNENEHSNKNN